MKRKQPEFLLHCVVADYLRNQYPTLLWLHPANGEIRSAKAGARLKRMGVRPGAPDIMIYWEKDHCLEGAAIELKADKGKLSDTQTAFMHQWTAIGGKYALCKSLDEVISHMESWGIPKVSKCPTMYAEGSISLQYVKPARKGRVE
jgi:hypothetical protein